MPITIKKSENLSNDYPEKRWLRILILWTIFEKSLYGYVILKSIEDVSRGTQSVKTGALYTILRRMEKEGLIVSSWERSDKGPEKRMYKISPSGKNFFKNNLEMICARKPIMDKLIKFYKINF